LDLKKQKPPKGQKPEARSQKPEARSQKFRLREKWNRSPSGKRKKKGKKVFVASAKTTSLLLASLQLGLCGLYAYNRAIIARGYKPKAIMAINTYNPALQSYNSKYSFAI
jgi:hypothetical protein